MIPPDDIGEDQAVPADRIQIFHGAYIPGIHIQIIHMKNISDRRHLSFWIKGDRMQFGRRDEQDVPGLRLVGFQVDMVDAGAFRDHGQFGFFMPGGPGRRGTGPRAPYIALQGKHPPRRALPVLSGTGKRSYPVFIDPKPPFMLLLKSRIVLFISIIVQDFFFIYNL